MSNAPAPLPRYRCAACHHKLVLVPQIDRKDGITRAPHLTCRHCKPVCTRCQAPVVISLAVGRSWICSACHSLYQRLSRPVDDPIAEQVEGQAA